MLCVCYSGYRFLVAINLGVLCRSTGKWQIEFAGEDTTAMKGEDTVLYCCLEAYKGIPCLCCSMRIWWYLRCPQGFGAPELSYADIFLPPAFVQLQIVLKPNTVVAR